MYGTIFRVRGSWEGILEEEEEKTCFGVGLFILSSLLLLLLYGHV